jgi:hypothetical protein
MRREHGLPFTASRRNGDRDGADGANQSSPMTARCDMLLFPYAILEIKLLDGDSCPDWVLVSGWANVFTRSQVAQNEQTTCLPHSKHKLTKDQ